MAPLPLLLALALVQEQPAPPVADRPAEAEQPADDENVMVPTPPPPPAAVPATPPPPPSVDLRPELAPSYTAPGPVAAGLADRRIQLLPYSPDQIVTLSVSPGFASVVELGADERVENVVVGNSAAWQVTANRRGDRVIVKPLSGAGQSNLIVLTGSRRYVFVLDPFGESSFIMRFTYPQAAEPTMAAASEATIGYRFRGNKSLFPLAMSDDGRRTIVRWNEQGVMPAIFAMNGRRSEQLVNGRMVGNDYVIEGAAPRYRFRYGKLEATAIRQTPKRRR